MSSDNTAEKFTETESADLILQNVSILSELSTQLKKDTKTGENYINSLSSLLFQAGKDMASIHQGVNSLLEVAKKLVFLSLQIVPTKDPHFESLKTQAEKLLSVLDEIQQDEEPLLDAKWRHMDKSLRGNLSSKSIPIDEKYPEHCSKESLIDLISVSALPTVHEDIFADFNRPSRTLSSGSLKNLRKVKMCLQRVSDIDDVELVEEKNGHTSLKTCNRADCGFSSLKEEANLDFPSLESKGTSPFQSEGCIKEGAKNEECCKFQK